MPSPYYVRLTPHCNLLNTELTTPIKGFYVFPSPGDPPDEITAIRALSLAYGSPATIHGSAQLMPRSKFSSNSIAVLNFRLHSLHKDMGNLGKTLEPVACAFFPKESKDLLIFEHIVYDLEQNKLKHKLKIDTIVKQLIASRSMFRTVACTFLI